MCVKTVKECRQLGKMGVDLCVVSWYLIYKCLGKKLAVVHVLRYSVNAENDLGLNLLESIGGSSCAIIGSQCK